MSQVWKLDLSASEKLVLLALADRADNKGRNCWPSVSTLAESTSQTDRTVRRALSSLEQKGHLTRKHREGTSTQYDIHPVANGAVKEALTPDTVSVLTLCPPDTMSGTPDTVSPNTSITIKNNIGGRARALPEGWTPKPFGTASKSFAVAENWSVDDLTEHIERFTAHHRARNSKFTDWQSAWSTWVLNTKKFEKGRDNGNRAANDTITNPYARAAARRQADRACAGF